MNDPIQITIKVTADKALIEFAKALVAYVKASDGNAGRAEPKPAEPEAAPEEPEPKPEDGFEEGLPPLTAADCIKAAREAKGRGVSPDRIRATVSNFGASRPQDVSEDRIPELFDALEALK